MRTIDYTSRFRRDFKRIKAGRYGHAIDTEIAEITALLAADLPLERRYADHPLTGDWADHRDCHLHPDLILIYRKTEPDHLELVRLGSHSELGL